MAPSFIYVHPAGADRARVRIGDSWDTRPGEDARAYVRRRPAGVAALVQAAKRLTRPLVVLLYLSPLLLVPKLALRIAGRPESDYITVGFVGLVVAVALFVTVTVALIAIAGPRSGRRERLEVELPPRAGEAQAPVSAAELELLATGGVGAHDRAVTVAGTLRHAHPDDAGAPVLVDAWARDGEAPVRLACAHTAIVDGGDGPPVVLAFDEPPVVVADYPACAELPAALAAAIGDRRDALTDLQAATLAAGDRVVIEAAGYEVVPNPGSLEVAGRRVHLDDDDDGGPYRERTLERGVLLRGPLVIRRG